MTDITRKTEVPLMELFTVFMKIGAFTIGGGYAMIPLIKDELDRRKWIGEDELPDIIALAQSAPGILAVNVSIFTGYKIRGVKGSIAATVGSVLPSVVSLIAAPTVAMAKKSCRTWWAWLIAIISLLLVSFLEVSPIYIIISVIVLALAAAKLFERR